MCNSVLNITTLMLICILFQKFIKSLHSWIMKHADGCSEHNTYQMKWVLTWIFGMSTFCSNYSITSLWHSVSIFPKNFNTNFIPCLLQHKPMAFFWMYNRSVQLFSNSPQICLMELWSGLWEAKPSICSCRFLPSQVVPAIVCFVDIVMANSTKTTETS